MNVVVVCQYYAPEPFAVHDLCKGLVARGHSVTVLTGLPNYPSGTVPAAYRHGKRREEWMDGVHVLRCPLVGRGKGLVRLALNYGSFLLSASRAARRCKADADAVLCYQLSPVLMAQPAALLKKKRGVPLLLYCLDLWPESLKAAGVPETSPLFRWMRGVSRKLYAASDRIAVPSEPFRTYLTAEHGIPEAEIAFLPQYADDAYLSMDFTPSGDVADFVFLGNVGRAQSIDTILRAAARLKAEARQGFLVHIVGGGSCLAECRQTAEELGLADCVRFYGERPHAEMPDFYRLADVCLLTLQGGTLLSGTIPAKLQGYLAAGKPVLVAADGAVPAVIRAAGCGIAVPAEDDEGLSHAMAAYLDAPERFRQFGENGRAYFAAHYMRERFLDELERLLRELVEENT